MRRCVWRRSVHANRRVDVDVPRKEDIICVLVVVWLDGEDVNAETIFDGGCIMPWRSSTIVMVIVAWWS